MSKNKTKAHKSLHGCNRHHLIYQRRHYDRGYAKMLRDAFIYPLEINIHNELHNAILCDVVRPSNAELKAAWDAYQRDRDTIASYDIVRACEWLMLSCSDPAWRACMARQLDFLRSRLGG